MCQGVAVLVVLARKTLGVVFARCDWALFRTLGLMRQHVRLEILEHLAALRVWASLFLLGVAVTVGTRVARVERDHAGPPTLVNGRLVWRVVLVGVWGQEWALASCPYLW